MAQGIPAYRDRLFSFIFGSDEHKDWTLSLYNAVNHTHYTDPESISIETIRQVLYMGMHNDVAFLVADILSLYEQQSTFNPNMPLRMLEYVVMLYEKHIRQTGRNKYGKALIPLPTPKLVVFYNGADDAPDTTILRLSDAFAPEHRGDADLEATVRMLNINRGRNQNLMDTCGVLGEYAWIVDSIRRLKPDAGLEAAIDRTIELMPDDFQTKPYLDAHKAEVKNMLLTEYNEAETMEMFKEEGRAEGRAEGRLEGLETERLNNIRTLIHSLKLSAQQAMDALGIPRSEQARYAERL